MSNVKCLLEKGASVNQTDRYGQTPLWLAIRTERLHVIELLLNNGASTDAVSRDPFGPLSVTLLSLVKKSGNERMINLIRRRQGISMEDWENVSIY